MFRPNFRFLLLCLICVLFAGPILAEDDAPALHPVAVTRVLATDPVPLTLPLFHDEERNGQDLDGLLDGLPAFPGDGWPCPGCGFRALRGEMNQWLEVDGAFTPTVGDAPAVTWLAFFVTSDRYQKASLAVTSAYPLKVTLNGADLALTAEEDVHTGEMILPIGKHLVAVRVLVDPAAEDPATGAVDFQVTPGHAAALAVCTTPERPVDIQTVLNAPRIGGVTLSPDGQQVAVSLSEYRDGTHHESWLEVRNTQDGTLQRVWRGSDNPSGLSWTLDGKFLTWRTTTDGKATVWTFDIKTGDTTPVLQDIADMGRWEWAPDGRSIIYAVTRTPDPDKRKVKRVAHPADRQSWWRGRSHLMQAFIPGGLTRQLTAGPVSASGWTLSPDGDQLLFSTSEPDLANRPFYDSKLYLLDLATLEAELLLEDPWIGGAQFSPKGDQLLLQGSPSAFGGLGRNLPEGVQANDYGGQLYLYDLATGDATAISLDLVPDIGWCEWSAADRKIYARTTDTQYSHIYRYDTGNRKWQIIETGMEYTNQLALPRKGNTAVARGTSASTPNRLYTVDLKKNKAKLLLDPGTQDYRDIVFGVVETWTTELPKGMELDGFVYYPPRFDKSKKYPLIVYYYGGTSPVTRDFGGRYPKNVWAGQDFIVYVPNPSGATGYGQEFAARHVNDWGILTADEVIEGTKAFLAAHDFVDPERVGCIGASYGGFLTEYLVTQTDIFAAAVSHAGISSLSSYWGEGLWGYVYGARALANSFPWQDRELYIEQSPLFHADKINTPLLLVHGDSDTNVPVGESDQLFTALKLLGREVEYVQIQGQDHHILDHEQRIVWNDTILAFFAKYLKERPEWWGALYPEPEDYR